MLPCINQIGEGWWGGVSAGSQEPGAVDGHTDHLRAHRDQAQPGLLQLPLQNAGLRSSTARGQRSVDICSDIYSFYSIDVYFSWLLIIAPIFTPSFFDTEVFFLWGIFHSHDAVIVDIFWLKTMKRVCTHVCYKNKKNIIIWSYSGIRKDLKVCSCSLSFVFSTEMQVNASPSSSWVITF